ncbi:MAG: glycosyltransferase [Ignavibacteriales bacterium]|nr:glycosyltransferase [Ignavibacteriales bacterium]
MSHKQKSIVITFLGNADQDSRVVNLIDSFSKLNYSVQTISFDWKTENFKPRVGKTNIYKLEKSNSSLKFYFTFFYLLIRDLIKYKADIYFSEDVYTLPVTYFFAKFNKSKIFYNSREIYAHLAGLRNKSKVQSIIAKIESSFIKKVDNVFVTGDMDKEFLEEKYQLKNILVLRNLPKYKNNFEVIDLRKMLDISINDKILLYQGVLLEGRGISKLIKLFDKINNAHFVIIGDGEFRSKLETEANLLGMQNKVHFLGSINHNALLNYTVSADLGLALIENISLSYYYALPNKIFEYIMAEVPVVCSSLPQMKNIVDNYKIGKYVDADNECEIINTINNLISDERLLMVFKQNCKTAREELNWEKEFEKIVVKLNLDKNK